MNERLFVGVMVIVGLIGGMLLQVFYEIPIVAAIFLAIGVASLVYGFLGGIPEASFALGPIKAGGSLAAFFGVAFFANTHLVQQTEPEFHQYFDPPPGTWFAVDRESMLPIDVEVPRANDSIESPGMDVFRDRALGLELNGTGIFAVDRDERGFIVGSLPPHVLRKRGFFNALKPDVRNFVVTGDLSPSSDVDLDPIELRLRTRTYSGDYSRYTLVNRSGETVHESAIHRRGGQIVEIDGRRYMVMVVQVNHEIEPAIARFAVGEVISTITAAN